VFEEIAGLLLAIGALTGAHVQNQFAQCVAQPDQFELGFVASRNKYAVDRDFVACLELAITAVQSVPVVEPNFMAGTLW